MPPQQRLLLAEASEHLGLRIAERLFPILAEDIADALAADPFDHAVGIHIGPAEEASDISCHRGLAGSEKADEEDMIAPFMYDISIAWSVHQNLRKTQSDLLDSIIEIEAVLSEESTRTSCIKTGHQRMSEDRSTSMQENATER